MPVTNKERNAEQARKYQNKFRENYRKYQREYQRKYHKSPHVAIPHLNIRIDALLQKMVGLMSTTAQYTRMAVKLNNLISQRDALQLIQDAGLSTIHPRPTKE